jgi:hypothetical protein
MKHLLTILEIQHLREGKVIWEAKNLPNTFHLEGERFILSAMFRSTAGISIPSFYYLGMDNRSTLSVGDNMASISTEPTGNGYSRQAVSSATGFEIEEYTADDLDHWRAKSTIVSFSASGSQWGPVTNVFLTDRLDNNGYLISTAPLGTTRFVGAGENITFRFAVDLVDQT